MSVLRRVLAWFREAFEAARPARDGRRSGGTMEIKRDRMVFLGYGKYWRSDAIVGLMPIEDERGPGRRTNVFVAGRAEPILASPPQRTGEHTAEIQSQSKLVCRLLPLKKKKKKK